MIIEVKNSAETYLLKRLLYAQQNEITRLEEHARSHGDAYIHPDRKAVDALLAEIEAHYRRL